MFELFKKRDFGALFNDTFGFFKLKWKNYFGNFFKVNFLILIAFMVIGYVLSQFYVKSMLGNINNPGMHNEYLVNYYMDNIGIIATAGFGMLILLLIISVIQIAFPVFYLQLLEKNGDYKPQSSEISSLIKQNFGRMLLFCLATFFVVGILYIFAYIIIMILTVLLIGFLLWIIVVPYFSALVYLSLYHYINKKSGYFEALGFAFNTLHNNFWKIVGSNLILTLIIQMVAAIIAMVPFMIIFFIGFVSMSDSNSIENAQWFVYSLGALVGVIMVLSVLLNNMVIVNFGLVYYGEMEKKESISASSEIDQIGLDE